MVELFVRLNILTSAASVDPDETSFSLSFISRKNPAGFKIGYITLVEIRIRNNNIYDSTSKLTVGIELAS